MTKPVDCRVIVGPMDLTVDDNTCAIVEGSLTLVKGYNTDLRECLQQHEVRVTQSNKLYESIKKKLMLKLRSELVALSTQHH